MSPTSLFDGMVPMPLRNRQLPARNAVRIPCSLWSDTGLATTSTAGTLVNFTNNTAAFTGTGITASFTGITSGIGLDIEAAMFESLTAIRRAGADMIITYFAPDVAQILGK